MKVPQRYVQKCYKGTLPGKMICSLVDDGFIANGDKKNVFTDTYDTVVSGEVYRLPQVFLPKCNEKIEDFTYKYGIRVKSNSILEKGGCYIFRNLESIAKEIPDNVYGFANPKSNIGRVDTLARTLADGVSRYDFVPAGYTGSLWSMVVPRSFSIIANEGMSFSQIRFFNHSTRLDEFRLRTIFNSQGGLLFKRSGEEVQYNDIEYSDKDGSILLSLGLDFSTIGFEAISNGAPIDLTKSGYYDPRDYFREIFISNGSINFNPHSFYILSTEESVRVLPTLACEMRPMDERSGEFRVHYAGFIAPGWGYGIDGTGKGRPLTLEVRSFENGLMVRKGQPFAKIRFEIMIEEPEVHYDKQPGSKFKIQDGPGLSKYFKEWK